MKCNKLSIILLVVVLLVMTVGCGGNSENVSDDSEIKTSDENVSSGIKVPKLPVTGFVGQFDTEKNMFVLAVLPETESQKPAEITVKMDENIEIIDKDGNQTTIKNYDRVTVTKGTTSSGEINATKIILEKSSIMSDFKEIEGKDNSILTKSVDYLEVPPLLISEIRSSLPKSFPKNSWVAQVPENHPTIPDAQIIELVNGDWSIYLLSNPKTEEKYSVTITDRKDFTWMGKISTDNAVIEN